MASQALSSTLAVLLEGFGFYTSVAEFASYLDAERFQDGPILTETRSGLRHARYLRSDEFEAALQANVAAGVMGVARASAEHRLLASELGMIEKNLAALSVTAAYAIWHKGSG